jgi:flavin reductase (DIM6/NTAB) family NADH-FMN oxidoreductase RutF
MKKDIDLQFATRLINNSPLLLIGSTGKNYDDISPVAWNMPGSKKPPTIWLTVGPSHETWKNIELTGEFSCNVVGKKLLDLVAYTGSVSGSDTDKFKITKAETINCKQINSPLLVDALAHIECKVIKMDKEEHLIHGEIIRASVDPELFEEHWTLDSGNYPINHLGGDFYQCGDKILISPRSKTWKSA